MRVALLPIVLVIALAGCRSPKAQPVLGDLYNRAAQGEAQEERPVVLLPGILGSRLVEPESKTLVWGAFTGDYANPGRPRGARLVALPMGEGQSLAELKDSVIADRAVESFQVDVLGLPVTAGAYLDILGTLGAGGYRDSMLADAGTVDYGTDHFTCFQFAYDWRRDNAESAAALYRYLLDRRDEVHAKLVEKRGEAAPAKESIRFDLVAHSMGGLVARYMLRYGDQPLPTDGSMPELNWQGASLVERVILVGTPNAGSAEAIRQLVEGKDFGNSVAFWLPEAPAAVLGTMPSIYQLLPRPRHGALVGNGGPVDFYDPAFWIDNKLGLMDPDEAEAIGWLLPNASPAERRRAAEDHLRKCLANAEQFHRALDVPAALPEGVELYLFAGDASETTQRLRINDGRLKTIAVGPGDETVLRSSALMDERLDGDWSPRLRTPIDWTGVNFLFQNHLGITRSAEFSDNVLYLLLEAPRGSEMASPGS